MRYSRTARQALYLSPSWAMADNSTSAMGPPLLRKSALVLVQSDERT